MGLCQGIPPPLQETHLENNTLGQCQEYKRRFRVRPVFELFLENQENRDQGGRSGSLKIPTASPESTPNAPVGRSAGCPASAGP